MSEASWSPVFAGATFAVIAAWRDLERIVACLRERFGHSSYENFEYLAARSLIWLDRYPDGTYPGRTPRMSEPLAKQGAAGSAAARR